VEYVRALYLKKMFIKSGLMLRYIRLKNKPLESTCQETRFLGYFTGQTHEDKDYTKRKLLVNLCSLRLTLVPDNLAFQ
jgi:hypothetical protein